MARVSEELKRLVLLGQEILQLPPSDDGERVISLLDEYLAALNTLDTSGATISRELVQELLRVHGELIDRARLEQNLVLNEIGELQKRSQVLRRYLDQSGSRVSITVKAS